MRRQLPPFFVLVGGMAMFLAAAFARGAQGIGNVFLPNSLDDPTCYTEVLEDLDGSGYLRGSAADVDNPMISRAYSPALDFRYEPRWPGADRIYFAETMAYYHVTAYQAYAAGLGFTLADQIPVTVFNGEPFGHLWDPIRTSYDPGTKRISLETTSSGMDSDAMDGDVIIHEYAHALQHELLGGQQGVFVCRETTVSEQATALTEGLADYAATSRFGDPEMGERKGQMQNRLFLRNVDNFLRWPGDFVEGDRYSTSMILSGAMWDLRSSIGQEAADTLAWEGVRTVPDNDAGSPELNTTFPDFLDAIVQADQALYVGAHEAEIRQAFAIHGIGSHDFSTAFPMVNDPGNDHDGTETYSIPGASALAVTFDEFVTKLDNASFTKDQGPLPVLDEKTTFDYLEILDGDGTVIGTYTGRELQGTTLIVPGDTVEFHLVTDSYLAPFGYRVTDIRVVPNLPGDANGDGCVDDLDLTALAVHWQQATNLWEHGDFDGNGIVDDLDLTALAVNWQQGCGGGGSFADAWAGAQASVPEPACTMLLLAGTATVIRRRR